MSAPTEKISLDKNAPITKTASQTDLLPEQVIFFDGICGLCNYFVDFVLKHDRNQQFLFAPLQGETAKKSLDQTDIEEMKSIVLIKQGHIFRRSAAVVRVLWSLPHLWKVAGSILWMIPGPLRDLGYECIAKIRYRIFGKKHLCKIPTPEERTRFLP